MTFLPGRQRSWLTKLLCAAVAGYILLSSISNCVSVKCSIVPYEPNAFIGLEKPIMFLIERLPVSFVVNYNRDIEVPLLRAQVLKKQTIFRERE